jgi:transposase
MGWRRGQAYSQDLRDRVLAVEGPSRAVAARFGVSVSYVIKARQRRNRSGETSARPQRSHTPRMLTGLHDAILVLFQECPDTTLNELRAWLLDLHGVAASMGLAWNTLDRLELTLKKRRSALPNRIVQISPKPVSNGMHCSQSSTQPA